MPNVINRLMLDELNEQLKDHEGGVFVDFSGIDVEQANELRAQFEDKDVSFKVLKNRIAKRAFDEMDLDVSEILVGPTAYAYGNAEQAIGAAKVISEMKKKKKLKELQVKGAIFEREVLDKTGAVGLANLPDRPTMQSMLASALIGPARGIATSISQVSTGLARCIQARIDKAEEDGE